MPAPAHSLLDGTQRVFDQAAQALRFAAPATAGSMRSVSMSISGSPTSSRSRARTCSPHRPSSVQLSRMLTDTALGLAFAADAIGNVLRRLDVIFLECELDPSDLQALANGADLKRLRKEAGSFKSLLKLTAGNVSLASGFGSIAELRPCATVHRLGCGLGAPLRRPSSAAASNGSRIASAGADRSGTTRLNCRVGFG